MVALSMMSSVMMSCFDPVTNEYRVTVPTYATVTKNEEGKVRLYLDENRGILTPNEKSEAINWGDNSSYVDYDALLEHRLEILKKAFGVSSDASDDVDPYILKMFKDIEQIQPKQQKYQYRDRTAQSSSYGI